MSWRIQSLPRGLYMDYEWEIVYINLDDLQLVLRLSCGTRRLIPMVIFDTAHFHDWKLGDHIAVDGGDMSGNRDVQKQLGMSVSEDDYTLFNKRTRGKAIVRKNDYECENAFAWLKELKDKGLIPPETK